MDVGYEKNSDFGRISGRSLPDRRVHVIKIWTVIARYHRPSRAMNKCRRAMHASVNLVYDRWCWKSTQKVKIPHICLIMDFPWDTAPYLTLLESSRRANWHVTLRLTVFEIFPVKSKNRRLRGQKLKPFWRRVCRPLNKISPSKGDYRQKGERHVRDTALY